MIKDQITPPGEPVTRGAALFFDTVLKLTVMNVFVTGLAFLQRFIEVKKCKAKGLWAFAHLEIFTHTGRNFLFERCHLRMARIARCSLVCPLQGISRRFM